MSSPSTIPSLLRTFTSIGVSKSNAKKENWKMCTSVFLGQTVGLLGWRSGAKSCLLASLDVHMQCVLEGLPWGLQEKGFIYVCASSLQYLMMSCCSV